MPRAKRECFAGGWAIIYLRACRRTRPIAKTSFLCEGMFVCAGCAQPLFDSRTKYESGSGWPSFYAPKGEAVGTSEDRSLLMHRTEVHCARCGGHLGHVFNDGPAPTGQRYCMNGAALKFHPKSE